MPQYLVTRIIHETKVIEAPDEETAITLMGNYGPEDVEVSCPDITAQPHTQRNTA